MHPLSTPSYDREGNVRAAMYITIVVALVIFIPLGAIASLNVLFGLSLPYTLATWASALFLVGVLGGSSVRSS